VRTKFDIYVFINTFTKTKWRVYCCTYCICLPFCVLRPYATKFTSISNQEQHNNEYEKKV
jgi:hypothetical protein